MSLIFPDNENYLRDREPSLLNLARKWQEMPFIHRVTFGFYKLQDVIKQKTMTVHWLVLHHFPMAEEQKMFLKGRNQTVCICDLNILVCWFGSNF